MRWTIAQVAGALGTRPGTALDPLARVAGVSIDSRTVRAGELFIAIHGPRHDGHDHVGSALGSGAIAAVVAESQFSRFAGEIGSRCIAVVETFEALKQLASAVRQAWGGKIAGVTGSVGKTTTKEILAALLGAKLRVLKSEGNLNNEYGLPLTLLRLEETHQAAVLEMGMSRVGELKRLAAIARPDVGVVTRVAPAHLEFFSSVDEIALAKRELIEGLNGHESTAVLNADDPRVAAFGGFAPGRVVTYGIEKPAFFMAQEIEDRGAFGSAFDYVSPEGRVRLELRVPGHHAISNALAALAAASVWDIGAAEAQSVFSHFARPGDAWRTLAVFERSGTDQRQLQLESRGAASDDGTTGGHAQLSSKDSCCGRNARTWRGFKGTTSGSGKVCGRDRQAGLDPRCLGRCGRACKWRCGVRLFSISHEIFRNAGRSG